jgi:hypothetical protein
MLPLLISTMVILSQASETILPPDNGKFFYADLRRDNETGILFLDSMLGS